MALVTEQDFGTPARLSPSLVTLEIDGQVVTVPAGTYTLFTLPREATPQLGMRKNKKHGCFIFFS